MSLEDISAREPGGEMQIQCIIQSRYLEEGYDEPHSRAD